MASVERVESILQMRRNGDTFKAIGERYGLTPQRVQQICKQHDPNLAGERNWRSFNASRKFDGRRSKIVEMYRGGTKDLHQIAEQTQSSLRFVRTTLAESQDIVLIKPWSMDEVVQAMVKWRRLHGAWPRSDEWMRRGEWWPSRATVVSRFGWSNCLDAAKVKAYEVAHGA